LRYLGREVVGARLLHRVTLYHGVRLATASDYRRVLSVPDGLTLLEDRSVARGVLSQRLGAVAVASLESKPARPVDAGERERDRRVDEAKERVWLSRGDRELAPRPGDFRRELPLLSFGRRCRLTQWTKPLDRPLELGDRRLDDTPLTGEGLGALVTATETGEITGTAAKEVFAEMVISGADPATIVAAKGLRQVTDSGAIEATVETVLAAHTDKVAEYRAGRDKLYGFFVGQIMRATQGKANPALVNELLTRKLAG